MRRPIALRVALYALIAAPSLLTALKAVVPAHAEDTPFISIVSGLAPDDLLNVRAKPSPIGKTEARIANGASVTNLGCNDIDGHQWCKIVSDNPKATGWTPARYLVPVNPAPVPDTDQPAAQAVTPAESGQPPPDLTARLGDVAHPAAPETPAKSAADTAMQDAYGLALAAAATTSTGDDPAAPAQDAAVDTQTVADLPPQPAALAPGIVGVPCARNVGQPMERCAATVVHKGKDKADVTVTWPDGGTRVISFRAGLPAASNGQSGFRFTREGSLNLIRIGASERFEITDTVAFGD